MKYSIAYGRNLDLKRMKEKCPHCVLVGQSVLKDWQLVFLKYISVEPCKGKEVPVAVWQIDDVAEKELDAVGGFPTLYGKQIVEVELNGKMVEALVYVMSDTHQKHPDKAYLQRLLIGYEDFKFDKKYILDAIERIPTKKVYILIDEFPKECIEACNRVGIQAEYGMDFKKVDACDGLLIPGGGDCDPARYHQQNIACKDINARRDEVTLQAIEYCKQTHKSVLGICLGMQYINVAYGGTLKQDIANHKDVTHKVCFEKGSLLFDYFGEGYVANSIHHQCVDRLGNGLRVIAQSEDKIVEAVEDKTCNILGVQWHPEKMQDDLVFEIFKTML